MPALSDSAARIRALLMNGCVVSKEVLMRKHPQLNAPDAPVFKLRRAWAAPARIVNNA